MPSGIWAPSEYARLPGYDGDIPDQVDAGASRLFLCHHKNGKLCSGWVGCHDMLNNLAIRISHDQIDDAVFDYVSPVPLFGSGAEAAAHGMRDIAAPSREARAKALLVVRIQRSRRR